MKSFTVSDARRRFGRLMETARREPVTITKNGRAAAMVLSSSDNELMAAAEGFLRSVTDLRGSLTLSVGAISAPGKVTAH